MHKTNSVIVALVHLLLLLPTKALTSEQTTTSDDSEAQQTNANATNITTLAENSKPDRCSSVHEFLIKPHFACLSSLNQNTQLPKDVKNAACNYPMQTQSSSHVVQFIQPPTAICHPYPPIPSYYMPYDPFLQHILNSLHLQEQTALNNIVYGNIFQPETEFKTVPLLGNCSCRKCQRSGKPKNIATNGVQQQEGDQTKAPNC